MVPEEEVAIITNRVIPLRVHFASIWDLSCWRRGGGSLDAPDLAWNI